MASQLDICNFALAEVGQTDTILTDLNVNTTSARLCSIHYRPAVQEVLREGMWKSARTLATLVQDTIGPEFGWKYSYKVPNDFLRIVFFNDVDSCDFNQELFEINGDRICTDETTVKIVYVRDLTIMEGDIGNADPLLVKSIYLNLANKMCWPLQQSRTLAEAIYARYGEALRRAKAADSRDERRPLANRLGQSNWIGARYYGTGSY